MKSRSTTHAEAKADQPVLVLIGEIKDRKVEPATLSSEDRRRCVEVLRGEGYTVAEIGQILKRNERTIRRDLDQLRSEHALAPHPRLAEQMVGQLLREAEVSVSRLRRIARDASVSGMEKLMAEGMAWKVHKELFEKLQSVGYLPRVATGIVADIYQHRDVEPLATYDDLANQVREIVEVSRETGQYSESQAQRCLELLDEVNRGRLAVRVEAVRKQSSNSAEDN